MMNPSVHREFDDKAIYVLKRYLPDIAQIGTAVFIASSSLFALKALTRQLFPLPAVDLGSYSAQALATAQAILFGPQFLTIVIMLGLLCLYPLALFARKDIVWLVTSGAFGFANTAPLW